MESVKSENPFYYQNILSINDFSRDDLEFLFTVASKYKSNFRFNTKTILQDRMLASLFFQASTRTKLSFDSAMQRLGGGVVGFADPKMTRSGDSYREDLRDTIRVVKEYADVIAIRHYETGAPSEAAKVSDVPVINAGDGYGEHPTQAMIDLFTIWERKPMDGLVVAIMGDLTQRSIKSFAYGISKWKVSIICVCPEELRWTKESQEYFANRNQSIEYVCNLSACIKDVDVLYVMSVEQPSYSKPVDISEYASDASSAQYIVDEETLTGCSNNMLILHPLPRKNEISREVDSLPQACYFHQSANGVPTRMALLSLIFGRLP